MASNTDLLSKQHAAPVSRRAYVWTPLMVTGSTHESMGFTRLSLFKLEPEVENFSAGEVIGVLKLAGATGTSRSSVFEGGTTTGVASSRLLG